MKTHVYEAVCRRRANEVLEECEITSAPVIPEDIAEAKGIALRIEERFPEDCYGALLRQGNDFSILTWSGCYSEGHRRFTIAHELGHYHLDGHVEALIPADGSAVSFGGDYRKALGKRDLYEVEADIFASELLMPERLVRPVIEALPPGLNAVRTLADRFGTSLSSAGVRYAALSPEPVAVLLSHRGDVEWAALSPAFNGWGWADRRVWRGEWTPPRSATRALARDPSRVTRREEASASGLLREWFPGAPAIETGEDALGLGDYGRVMTVLVCPELPLPDDPDEVGDDAEREPEDWRDAMRTYRLG